ncbi:MAG: LacI family DNA-binding transcriptional regulator [Hasllibacter sp.]
MSGKITSAEVAARAGVSRSAVSRVFSGASASKDTALKVRKAAAELGYRPNVLARSLITGRSRIVGLIVAYLDNQFYPDALERLSNALQAEGYHILVFTARDGDDSDALVEQLLDYQVDGIVAASVTIGDDLARRCQAAGIPVVLFNRGQDATGLSQVTSANRTGGAEVARFLKAGGHRRIAQITGWQGATTGRDRAAGFREALPPLVAEEDGMFDRDRAGRIAVRMWREHRVDALFVGNDHMALGVIDALRTEGVDVGRQVSVVGYDDVPAAAWAAYDLTTVRQPAGRMVEATVETLLGLVDDPDRGAARIEIEGPLILRGSARIPEGWR